MSVGRLIDTLTIDKAAFEAEQDRLVRHVLGAMKRTVAKGTRKAEQDLEAATRAASPGRLWRAWQSAVSPGGDRLAREPVGFITLKGKHRTRGAIEYLTTSGRITGKSGQYLAIPTAAAGGRGRGAGRAWEDNSPAAWERQHGVRLRFVYRPGKPSLLVLDQGRLAGKKQIGRLAGKRAQAKGAGATIVMFVLLPVVTFGQRFSVEAIVNRVSAGLPAELVREIG